MRTAKWSRETQGKTQIVGRDGVGVGGECSCQASWRAKGKEKNGPPGCCAAGRGHSLGSGLTEQTNPRNLIFGICRIEEPAANSLAAEIAGRSGRREFRETDFHLIREGPASHGCATMRRGLGRKFCRVSLAG